MITIVKLNKTKEINSLGLKIFSSWEKDSGNGIIISNNMFISSEITTAPIDMGPADTPDAGGGIDALGELGDEGGNLGV